MSLNSPNPNKFNESALTPQSFWGLLVAMFVGFLMAALVLPSWLPNMAFSFMGGDPKVYWYLARATSFVALSLLWMSMALGLGITNKMARLWPGAPAAFAIHEYVSLLGLAFALFHAFIILGDHYIHFTLLQIFIPFSAADYRPLWVGIGQLGLYLWALLALSFYLRPAIGQKTWRALHFASFAMYLMGIAHGIFSGTDTSAGWAQNYYWLSVGSLLFLLMYRLLAAFIDKNFPEKKAAPAAAPRPTR